MILNYPLTQKDTGGGGIPPIPPIDPQAVDGASFLRKGADAELTITDVVESSPLEIKSFLFSCFYRAAPSIATEDVFEFVVKGDIKARVKFGFSIQDQPDVTKDNPFLVEFIAANGDSRSGFMMEIPQQPVFLRENSWHHIFILAKIKATDLFALKSFLNMGMTCSDEEGNNFFPGTEASFTPLDTSVNFTFKSRTEAKYAAFEPSLAHCYCEISSDPDGISANPDDFINMDDGTPKEITASFGGTPMMYAFVDETEPLLNTVSGNTFNLSTTDWEAVGVTPIVTCAYQAFQHTHIALKQEENYGQGITLRTAAVTLPEGECFANFWIGDFFTDKGSGMRVDFMDESSGSVVAGLIVDFDGTNIYFAFDIQTSNCVLYDTIPQPKGWVNVSVRWNHSFTTHPTEIYVKINDSPSVTLGNPAPDSRSGSIHFSFNCFTPTQNFGALYFYDADKVAANAQVDWTDLDALHERFVSPIGEPLWNGMDGAAAIGVRPTVFVNPALGNGHLCRIITDINDNIIYSVRDLDEQPLCFTGRCTYFRPGLSSGTNRALEPFELFNEITYKV